MNYVRDKYSAVINGKSTALAACDNLSCDSREHCLRSSAELAVRVFVKRKDNAGCTHFIPVEEVKA